MSQTGILNITSPISGLQITPISISSPTNTQTLVHNGTAFANSAVPTISLLQHYAISYYGVSPISITTPGVNVQTTYTGTSPTSITLNPGTYIIRYNSILNNNVGGANISLFIVKTGGSGTFTSDVYTNADTNDNNYDVYSQFTGNDTTGGTLFTGGGGVSTFNWNIYSQGRMTVSTASVTLAFAASSTSAGVQISINTISLNAIQIA